jgi:hypothetical protein
MQREAELLMLDEWKETVGAVVDPFNERAVVARETVACTNPGRSRIGATA